MTTSYVDVFTSSNIYASEVSQTALTLTADVSLNWPLDAPAGTPIASKIIDVTSTGAYAITMPASSEVSVGQTVLFNNLGANAFTVKSSGGTVLMTVQAGTQWQAYLTDNSTASGVWQVYQFGASTSTANAGALAGQGLTAIGSTLNQNQPVLSKSVNYSILSTDRASVVDWTGGLGTFTLPVADADWFCTVKNSGSGAITIDPSPSTIDGAVSKTLNPGDSCSVVCDGANYISYGFGQVNEFLFDYTVVDVSGAVDYTLTGSQLNRIAYDFIGVISADLSVIVPASVQQYWVKNSTTGASLSIKTAAQPSAVLLAYGVRGIYFCDGSEVVSAVTSVVTGSVSGGTF